MALQKKMVDISIATYNVHGLRDNNKRRKIFNYLHEKAHHVTFLQETHSTPSIEGYWSNEWGRKIYYCHITSESRGAILFSKNVQVTIKNIVCDRDGRYIIIKVIIAGYQKLVALCSLYSPNEDSPAFFQQCFRNVEQVRADHNIIGGDFNTVMTQQDIKGGKEHTHVKSTSFINEYCETNKLVDIWRVKNPEVFRFTWAKRKPHPLMEKN